MDRFCSGHFINWLMDSVAHLQCWGLSEIFMCLCSLCVFVINRICSSYNTPYFLDLPIHGRLLKAHIARVRARTSILLAQFTVSSSFLFIQSRNHFASTLWKLYCQLIHSCCSLFLYTLPYVLMDRCICQCGTLSYATHTADSTSHSTFRISWINTFIADCRMT